MRARCMAIVLGALAMLWIARVPTQAGEYEGGKFFGRGTMHGKKSQARVLPHPIRDYALTTSSDRNKKPKDLKGGGKPTFRWKYNPKRVDGH